ncbi:hypothetical protein BZL35_00032 [Candidatus Pandoraea novymonadis]|uniref:Uncharacterized protein n=1 Tax=Candidatus Pandoraea novymonadis TaxID=1808959 RepID=A0ABX5FDI8_9BURK|nr:hypothetical protein BZL35_00032 [Candidatus Pandoraea novymonadis]
MAENYDFYNAHNIHWRPQKFEKIDVKINLIFTSKKSVSIFNQSKQIKLHPSEKMKN